MVAAPLSLDCTEFSDAISSTPDDGVCDFPEIRETGPVCGGEGWTEVS